MASKCEAPPLIPPRTYVRPQRNTLPGSGITTESSPRPPRPPPRPHSFTLGRTSAGQDILTIQQLDHLRLPRRHNDYVETSPGQVQALVHKPLKRNNNVDQFDGKKAREGRETLLTTDGVILSQPKSLVQTFRKPSSVPSEIEPHEDRTSSIICQDCGRCRCAACASKRPLPEKLLCGGNCICSADSVVDILTCMCFVKALFYHCCTGSDGEMADVSPCSCQSDKKCLRFGVMGLLSIPLPCLWCYCPMKGAVKLCEKCYSAYHNQGCRCSRNTPREPPHIARRLLETS